MSIVGEGLLGTKIILYVLSQENPFYGEVIDVDSDDIVLQLDGSVGFFSRDKIVAILIMEEETSFTEEDVDHESPAGYDISAIAEYVHDEEEIMAPANDIGHGNQYGSLIPGDMLIGDDEPEVDLSISMSTMINPPTSRESRYGPKEED
jgi:hypothetical protein